MDSPESLVPPVGYPPDRGPHPGGEAGRVLLCADAWTNDLLAGLDAELPLVVTQEHTPLPATADAHDHTATCLYTLTPDRDLVLGPVGGHDVDLGPFAPDRPALTAAEPEARYLV